MKVLTRGCCLADFTTSPLVIEGPEKVRARTLALAYSVILSWPDPREKKIEPTNGDHCEDIVAGSENESPAEGGFATSPHPKNSAILSDVACR